MRITPALLLAVQAHTGSFSIHRFGIHCIASSPAIRQQNERCSQLRQENKHHADSKSARDRIERLLLGDESNQSVQNTDADANRSEYDTDKDLNLLLQSPSDEDDPASLQERDANLDPYQVRWQRGRALQNRGADYEDGGRASNKNVQGKHNGPFEFRVGT
ncbi:hypothetical protein NHJ13734_008260 [Beauveria thailandica]